MSCNNITYIVLILKKLLLYKYALFTTLFAPLTLKMKSKHYCGESAKIYLTSQKQQHCSEKLKFRSNQKYLNSRSLKFTVSYILVAITLTL